MNIGNENFNLLVPLNALLTERSVTGAARILHVGQPAMSAALSRLRSHFDDELLARVGNAYELTPLAESLVDAVAVAVEMSTQALRVESAMDFSRMRRTFKVGMSEYELEVLAPDIMNRVRSSAPLVSIAFDLNSTRHLDDLASHLRTLDCMTMPSLWEINYPHIDLFTDSLCVVVAGEHPIISTGCSPEALRSLRWAASGDGALVRRAAKEMLDYDIPEEDILATVSSIHGLIDLVAGSDLACILPRRILVPHLEKGSIRAIDPPQNETEIGISLYWHPVRTRDRSLDWLRRTIVDSARSLTSAPGQP